MLYISEESWSRLPMIDLRSRFFIEVYAEKLSVSTPHFAQARLMNVFSSCVEMLGYIEEYKANDKNGGYVLSALDEIDSCFSIDQVACELFKKFEELRKDLFKTIRQKIVLSDLDRLRVVCKAIISREDDYLKSLLGRLRNALVGEVDLSKSKRMLDEINGLTGLYVTHLLNKGYSPTYLFNRVSMFTRANNYMGRDFGQQFDYITSRLNTHKARFKVYFALKIKDPKILISIVDDSDFKFDREFPDDIGGSDLARLRKDFKPDVIVSAEIDATDYISASWRIKDKLDIFLDAVTALDSSFKIKVSSNCAAVQNNNGKIHVKVLNISFLIGFLASESGAHLANRDTPIRFAFAKLDMRGREQLGRSLRYLRLAQETVSLEQKLLNLWIALESLFPAGENSILTEIVQYLPTTYAVSGLARRISYLKNALAKTKVPAPSGVLNEIAVEFLDDSLKDVHLFSILRNDVVAKELFEYLSPKESLKYKLITAYEQIKSTTSVLDGFKATEADVERQLRRIYFLRNKIAHTGHHSNIRPQLITHLLDYLSVCYVAISSSAMATDKNDCNTIKDLLGAYKMGVDVLVSQSRVKKAYTDMEDIIPMPMI